MAVKTLTRKSTVRPMPKASVKSIPMKVNGVKKIVAPLHIAIAGNIGAGKTTLTTLLAKSFKWEPHFEDVDDNPYLNDFYDDMQRWSFNLQIYFLKTRFEHINKIRKSTKTVIQDRTIYEDAFIFAPNLHSMGLMTTRDFNSYQALFEQMSKIHFPLLTS